MVIPRITLGMKQAAPVFVLLKQMLIVLLKIKIHPSGTVRYVIVLKHQVKKNMLSFF